MDEILALLQDPSAWVALVTLIVMEVVLGIDNLLFISILTNKLPKEDRARARRIGIGLALVMRLGLLATVAWLVQLVEPLFTVFEHPFSVKDLILIAGGLFLVWKATKEIHHNVDTDTEGDMFSGALKMSVQAAIVQILLRLGFIGPVVGPAGHDLRQHHRGADGGRLVRLARFQHADTHIPVA